MQRKLNMTPDQVLAQAVHAVQRARRYTDDVEFSPEDAGRSEIDFLCRVLEAVIDAGAGTVNIPDTVGYNIPDQFGSLIRTLRERIPNADKAIFSVHCHNDLGLAVANSLAAVRNGARQVECTINGLGERAGNAALEEIVMTVRTRQDLFDCQTRLDTTQIMNCSRLVSGITGLPFSRTRRWSAPTPSRTSPASIRTGCSSIARPTRSCAPRTSVGTPIGW
jgi:2-isopropylmalate synthase